MDEQEAIALRAAVPWAKQHHLRVALLQRLDEEIAAAPDALGPRVERAGVFADLGLRMEAIAAYADVLSRDAHRYDAMLPLAKLLGEHGDLEGAKAVYYEAARAHPHRPEPLTGLGEILLALGDEPGARTAYEAALTVEPGYAPAHRGLAPIYHRAGEREAAERAWRAGYPNGATAISAYRGPGEPVRVLLLMSVLGGNVPLQHVLDAHVFQWAELHVETHRAGAALPPHALVFNAIGDADRCAGALEVADAIASTSGARLLNAPARVRETGRVENARRLGALDDVVAPRIARYRRDELAAADAAAVLARDGFAWPVLVRSPGYHTGEHFTRAADLTSLRAAIADFPGDELLAIEYLHTPAPDGTFRKYRVLAIDGRLYPLHLAIGREWKVHYFSAAMEAHAAFREEEHRFLADMHGVLGSRAITALKRIASTLGLAYCGIDFALDGDGRVVLYEANATMVILPAPPGEQWDYRRPAIDAALQAARALLLRSARPLP
jgi:tetratricopeptide (TPR) repeat protein